MGSAAEDSKAAAHSHLDMLEVLEDSKRQLVLQMVLQRRCDLRKMRLLQEVPDFEGCAPDFDGLLCWGPARLGAVLNQTCPLIAVQPDAPLPGGEVARTCGSDGEWQPRGTPSYQPCGLDDNQTSALLAQLRTLAAEGVGAGPPAPGADLRFLQRRLEECNRRRGQPPPAYVTRDESRYCPITFDGWTCWDFTPAGSTAYNPCPDFVMGFDPRRSAFRVCLDNGTWFHHPQSNRSWSNYTTCIDMEDLQFRQVVNQLYVIGYTISFVALLVSLLIFFSFRALKCTRIAIHVQLFLSFAANNLMWLVWYRHVIGDISVLNENAWPCQALHVLLQYLMVANYMWMFCEGLHLHLALVVVFVKDELVMRWFHFVGWVLPALVAAVYAYWRSSRPDDTRRCWMGDSVTQWALTVPVLLSLAASAVFLVNVLRVLLTKLHCNSANPAPVGLRKAARAALILVPLFGLQHVALPFRPEPGARGEQLYQLFAAVVISLQGLCVSCLFCFANVDVHCAVRPLLRRACPFLARGSGFGGGGAGGCGCDSGPLGAPHTHTHTQSRDVCV